MFFWTQILSVLTVGYCEPIRFSWEHAELLPKRQCDMLTFMSG